MSRGPDLGAIAGPVVIPGCCQVVLKWVTPSGRQALNVLHASVPGGFAATTAIANAIHTALSTGAAWDALKALMGTASAFEGVRLLDLRAANNAPVDSTSTSEAGTSAADPLSPATSLVITLRTARAGPGFRGRIYIPNWTVDAVTGLAEANAGAVAALQAWANTIPTAFSGSSISLAIAQPARAAYTGSSGTAHLARAAATQLVTQLVVRNGFWDNQRRRGGRS